MKITPETMNIFNSFDMMQPIDQMTRDMAFHIPHQNAIYAMYGVRHFTENVRVYSTKGKTMLWQIIYEILE